VFRVTKIPFVAKTSLEKMVAASCAPPDSESVFFVPFDSSDGPSKLTYALGARSKAGSPDEETMPFCYNCLDVTVPSALLRGGKPGTNIVYRIKRDDNVLLRPPDNSEAPRVGRIYAIFSREAGAKVKPHLRVQWYYHATDVQGYTTRPTGEDELLETPHFNDVDADTVVGRCTVTSHEEYVLLVREKVNSAAVPVLEADSPDDGKANGERHDAGDNDDKDDDEGSVVGDNYASASTRYFLREYYNACKEARAITQFEQSTADPEAEIDNNYDSDEGSVVNADERDDAGESDDSDVDDGVIEDDDEPKPKQRRVKKRRRVETVVPAAAPRPSRGDASQMQFSLPDISIGQPLPCRETEKAAVCDFLRGAIERSAKSASATGRCLYVSGVPGTGKTATVREIIANLRALLKEGNIPPFEAIEVNGMTLADPNLIYSELYAAVVGQRGVSPARSQVLLEQRFASMDERVFRGGTAANARERGQCVIVVLDEMDVLVSRNEELLHKLLDWSARSNSRLALVGIANTMDLPERLLAKSKSRMGDNRLVYPPYTKNQLIEILDLRLRDFDIGFDRNAITLVSSKIAALSGDVRRALELCRRAAEFAREAAEGRVGPVQVNKAIEDMTGGARIVLVASRPLNDRIVLVATLLLSRSMGAFDVDSSTSLPAVFRKCIDIASNHKEIFSWNLETEELQRAVSRLVADRILLVERDAHGGASRVVINMSPEDVIYALADDAIAKAELHVKGK
jgi:Cdc6-like AAA superfamily ATPase